MWLTLFMLFAQLIFAHLLQTFFITDPNAKDLSKAARACDACYETVFPLLDPTTAESPAHPASTFTLSGFPSWQSMPALAMPGSRPRPSALMTIDVNHPPKRVLPRIDDVPDSVSTPAELDGLSLSETNHNSSDSPSSQPVIRVTASSRPRSFHHILEGFQDKLLPSPSTSHFSAHTATDESAGTSSAAPPELEPPRREDTARRHKRFSLPAIALHTTPVTARPNSSGEGLAKRFSLVLGGKHNSMSRTTKSPTNDGHPPATDSPPTPPLKYGAAAIKLGELLGRRKRTA